MNLDVLADACHQNSIDKGFWDDAYEMEEKHLIRFWLSLVALVHSEPSEVLEAIRKQKGQDKVVEEIADSIIRLFDLYSGLIEFGVVTDSLDDAVRNKLWVNYNRPHRHGVLA